jgi:hypothetical protein
MSREPSAPQSEKSLHTEPGRLPPRFSPSPAFSPNNRASTHTNFTRSVSPMIDTRPATQITFGTGDWAAQSAPSSPLSIDAPIMSRGSSGPGMMVDSGDGMSRSLIEFGHVPSTQLIRFGDLDPISVEEARRRTDQHERQLELHQGRYRSASPYQPVLPPYPNRNLMPSASNTDQLQEMSGQPQEDAWGQERVTSRTRSGSSPTQPNFAGLGLRVRR